MSNPTLAINFTGNISPLLSSLQKANGGLAGFEASIKGGGSSLSNLAAGAGLTALAMKGLDGAIGLVRSGVGMLAGALSKGIGLAAEAEQAQISFEVMLGSAKKAQDMLGQIRNFAAATPFESPELIKASKSLLAMGINAKEVVPTLRMLGDVASGTGIPIENMATMYGKMSAGGRVLNDDLRQLAENGVPVFDMLAKQMGVPTTSLRKLAEQGKISFSHLRNAMIDMTGAGGKFESMTQRQSQTLTGLWSTLKDNVNLSLMAIGEQMAKNLNFKGAVSAMSDAVESMQGPMLSLISSVSEGFKGMATAAGGSSEAILGAMQHVAGALATVADWLKTIVDLYKSAQIGALRFAAGVASLTPGKDARQRLRQNTLDADEMENELAKSNSNGSFASQSDAFFAKAMADLMNKRFLAQQDEANGGGKKGAPAALSKVDPNAGAPGDKLKSLFPVAGMVSGLLTSNALARLPGAKALNDRLQKGGLSQRDEYKPMQAAMRGSQEEASILNKARFDFQNRDTQKVEEKTLDFVQHIFTDLHQAVANFQKPAVLDVR